MPTETLDQAWLAAFASQDAAKGGCPDLMARDRTPM